MLKTGTIIAERYEILGKIGTVYGGGEEGVQLYVQKLKAELADTMRMCGAHSLADIDRSMLYGF